MISAQLRSFPPIHLHYSWSKQPSEPGIHYAMTSCSDEQLVRAQIELALRVSLDSRAPRTPAGHIRGHLPALTNHHLVADLNMADRDTCYDAGINPIKYRIGYGFVLWGGRFVTLGGTVADIVLNPPNFEAQINPHFIALCALKWNHAIFLPTAVSDQRLTEIKHWLADQAQQEYDILRYPDVSFATDVETIVFFESDKDAVNFKLFFYY